MKRGRLSQEDARLWAGVARSVRPLPGKAVPPQEKEDEALLGPAFEKALSGTPAAPLPAAPAPGPRPLGLHPIEKPVRRKLSKGRLPIEARIDLHEMTQGVAHYALLGFLSRAHAQGLRHVLVITGRGGGGGALFGARGVLRRVVPHWFETPEFRRYVSGFEPAERHHGGDGALYVRLRRRP
ncbi:Smr/MutS family protein [Aurantimonas sp. Leaf443]|uniref:Smr/MutS family protein n=1 Tax=Aurantimonas sp. Leaf443 TaxID=1736378 RepID=UPI0006FE3848|nr:Smr/MutS family protein [Aurantimonas sp. Leaf443]KQT85555.1 DNA mismatch repair protein MutS [Aurantimonas sp. Leaf443]